VQTRHQTPCFVAAATWPARKGSTRSAPAGSASAAKVGWAQPRLGGMECILAGGKQLPAPCCRRAAAALPDSSSHRHAQATRRAAAPAATAASVRSAISQRSCVAHLSPARMGSRAATKRTWTAAATPARRAPQTRLAALTETAPAAWCAAAPTATRPPADAWCVCAQQVQLSAAQWTHILQCVAVALQPPSTCYDGVRNGAETGIDCGGLCGACIGGQDCLLDRDCISGKWEVSSHKCEVCE
jgi:hypothetical protein